MHNGVKGQLTPIEKDALISSFVTDTVDDDDEGFLADVGFMFEASQPVRLERFQWHVPNRAPNSDNDSDKRRKISVSLHVADESPGAIQSGHYLWPAATHLCDYLVSRYQTDEMGTASWNASAISIVELGAGCGLVSLTALQLWQDSLQCVCVTDHDPGTLIRAKDNLETTMQALLEECNDDDHLNAAINNIVSIPVIFESLEWGNVDAANSLLLGPIRDHVRPPNAAHTSTTTNYETEVNSTPCVSIVLGSDLIYCADVVKPLLETASLLLKSSGSNGVFLLSQSFAYDPATEIEINQICSNVGFRRTILVDEEEGSKRIQEFSLTE